MPDLRPAFAPIAALALCGLALASISTERASRSEGSIDVAAIATVAPMSDGTSLPDAEPMQSSCGDGRCSAPEDCNSCPSDCGSCCGDGRCYPPEDARSCPRDCS